MPATHDRHCIRDVQQIVSLRLRQNRIIGREIEIGDREVRQAERERVCGDAADFEFARDIAGKRTLRNAEHAKPRERPPEFVRPVAARRRHANHRLLCPQILHRRQQRKHSRDAGLLIVDGVTAENPMTRRKVVVHPDRSTVIRHVARRCVQVVGSPASRAVR